MTAAAAATTTIIVVAATGNNSNNGNLASHGYRQQHAVGVLHAAATAEHLLLTTMRIKLQKGSENTQAHGKCSTIDVASGTNRF